MVVSHILTISIVPYKESVFSLLSFLVIPSVAFSIIRYLLLPFHLLYYSLFLSLSVFLSFHLSLPFDVCFLVIPLIVFSCNCLFSCHSIFCVLLSLSAFLLFHQSSFPVTVFLLSHPLPFPVTPSNVFSHSSIYCLFLSLHLLSFTTIPGQVNMSSLLFSCPVS